MMNRKPDYANWVSKKFRMAAGIASGVALVLLLLSLLPQTTVLWTVIRAALGIIGLLFLLLLLYMSCARWLLSYEGGGVQGKLLDHVLSFLDWNGQGRLLDIGCGSGAMTIKAAKKYPQAQATGMDYWGPGWDYAKSQCEQNAQIECVADRVFFQKGDAAHLDFRDNTFDAAISNFVFHEVRTQSDKTALIREALRVIKPGGVFAFSDVYHSKSAYPDLNGMVKALSQDVAELHFVDTRENDFTPAILRTPLIMGDMGLIYGRK